MLTKIFVLIYNLFFLHIIKYWKLLQIMNYKKEQIYLDQIYLSSLKWFK